MTTDSDPAWSPSGDRVAFSSIGDAGKSLYIMSAAGGNETVAVKNTGPNLSVDDWSRDGRFLLYHDPQQMLAVNLMGDRQPISVVSGDAGQVDEGAFSPDAKAVAYNYNETGRNEVFVTPFPPNGAKWKISNNGGVQPRWRGDGRELYYLAPNGTLMVVDVLSPAPNLKISAPRALFETRLLPSAQTDQYAVTSDGQQFLVMDPLVDERTLPLHVILNWQNLLETK
jgi:Tol biopolymer transport system component